MPDWFKRHTPEAILIPVALSAATATALSNVPEAYPFGQELGLGVMGVGYSYIAAYIFNWLVVVRPKTEALKAYYAASYDVLLLLSFDPALLVLILSTYCDADPGVKSKNVYSEGASEETVSRIFTAILALSPNRREEIRKELSSFLEDANSHYEQLAALFSQFEPEVSVAIAGMRPDPMAMTLLENPMVAISEFGWLIAPRVVDYQLAGRRLSIAMRNSRYMPKEPVRNDPPLYPAVDRA